MAYADELAPSPHLTNSFWIGNRISPACDRNLINNPASNDIYRDKYFGNAWSWTPELGAAVYGKTENLPASPIEELGSGQFLRVPFRRIPIIDVHSVDELVAFSRTAVSKDASVRGVWRGQARQYAISRSNDDKLRLYGDVSVVEPSLLPSASRSGHYFPDLFETWAGLLDLFIEQHVGRLANTYLSRREELEHTTRSFWCGYGYRLWGFATAQHYGLPSVGLDVTHDVLVALFFALHRFSIDSTTGAMSMVRATEEDDPIIYGMGGFEKHDLLDDEELAPAWLQCTRPKAQGAHFFATGWGDASNKAADRIYVALRLVNHTQWRSPHKLEDIFPSNQDDFFLDFLLKARSSQSDSRVTQLLQKIYFVP